MDQPENQQALQLLIGEQYRGQLSLGQLEIIYIDLAQPHPFHYMALLEALTFGTNYVTKKIVFDTSSHLHGNDEKIALEMVRLFVVSLTHKKGPAPGIHFVRKALYEFMMDDQNIGRELVDLVASRFVWKITNAWSQPHAAYAPPDESVIPEESLFVYQSNLSDTVETNLAIYTPEGALQSFVRDVMDKVAALVVAMVQAHPELEKDKYESDKKVYLHGLRRIVSEDKVLPLYVYFDGSNCAKDGHILPRLQKACDDTLARHLNGWVMSSEGFEDSVKSNKRYRKRASQIFTGQMRFFYFEDKGARGKGVDGKIRECLYPTEEDCWTVIQHYAEGLCDGSIELDMHSEKEKNLTPLQEPRDFIDLIEIRMKVFDPTVFSEYVFMDGWRRLTDMQLVSDSLEVPTPKLVLRARLKEHQDEIQGLQNVIQGQQNVIQEQSAKLEIAEEELHSTKRRLEFTEARSDGRDEGMQGVTSILDKFGNVAGKGIDGVRGMANDATDKHLKYQAQEADKNRTHQLTLMRESQGGNGTPAAATVAQMATAEVIPGTPAPATVSGPPKSASEKARYYNTTLISRDQKGDDLFYLAEHHGTKFICGTEKYKFQPCASCLEEKRTCTKHWYLKN